MTRAGIHRGTCTPSALRGHLDQGAAMPAPTYAPTYAPTPAAAAAAAHAAAAAPCFLLMLMLMLLRGAGGSEGWACLLAGFITVAVRILCGRPLMGLGSLWYVASVLHRRMQASGWEWTTNHNVKAARSLLQRGLRLNPDSRALYKQVPTNAPTNA